MKLTIVHPCIGRLPGKDYIRSWQMEPLPAAYLAAMTPSHWERAFYDDRMERIPFDDPTDLVAISVETYTAKRAYQIATEFRRRGVPVVMGGFHATLQPDEVCNYAEAVVCGESEQLFPGVLKDFENGTMKRIYRMTGRSDLAAVRPDRSIFQNKRYLKLGLVEAARGCAFKCDFCAITSFFNATQTRRPVEHVLEEIRGMKASRKLFFFVDDNIASSLDEAKLFFRALIPLKIRWVSQASITMTHDDELLGIMRESGCQGVLIGLESLNPDNLKLMNKGFNKSRGGFRPALQKLRDYGIRLYATFVFGYDHDTPETFDQTVEFCREEKIFMVAFNHLTPFPGTPLYRRLEKEGRLLYERWWLDDRYQYGQVPFRTGLDPEWITNRCISLRKEFYGFGSTWQRMFSRTNSGNLFMLRTYWFINLLLRKEASQRENYPLGDRSFKGELLQVKDPLPASPLEPIASQP